MHRIQRSLAIIIAVSFLVVTNGTAQMHVLSQRIGERQHVGEIMEIVDAYYAEIDNGIRTLTDEPKYKHWARWAYWASMHTDAQGNIIKSPELTHEAIAETGRDHTIRSSAGNWFSMGPAFITSDVDDAIGIGRADRIVFHPTDPNLFYVCTPTSGLLKTTNHGATYTHLTDNLPTTSASGLVISSVNSNTLYLLTGDGDGGGLITSAGYRQYSDGVYISDDAGANWRKAGDMPFTSDATAFALVQDPVNPAILLAATSEGIFRTTDAGDTWTLVLEDLTYELKYQTGTPYYAYATQSGKFFRSVNAGSSWEQISNFDQDLTSGRIALAVTMDDPDVVYLFSGASGTDTDCLVAGTFGGIYYSNDQGTSFFQRTSTPNIVTGCCDGENGRSQQAYDLAIGVSHADQDFLVTGGLRVWRSATGGFTMHPSDPACSGEAGFIHVDIHDVEYNPLTDFVYACCDGGVYYSVNHGVNWNDLNAGLANSQIYHMGGSLLNTEQVMSGLQDNGIVSFGGVTTWSHEAGGDGFDCMYDHHQEGSGYFTSNSQIYRFTDNGDVVTNVTPPTTINFFPKVEMHRTDANIVFAGYANMKKSTNGGNSWASLNIPGNWDIASCETNTSRFYAAGGNSSFSTTGSMRRTDNTGVSWTILSGNPGFPTSDIRITDIEVSPVNASVVWISCAGYSAGEKVFYSSNAGLTWTNLSGALPNIPVNAIQVDASGNAYVGTDIGVYYRANSGNWIPFWNRLPIVPVTDLELYEDEEMIRASTFGRGVWYSDTYSTCASTFLLITGLSGHRYFEASNTISATSIISGGENTEIVLKAGDEIVFGTGFHVLPGCDLRAYTAPCGVVIEE